MKFEIIPKIPAKEYYKITVKSEDDFCKKGKEETIVEGHIDTNTLRAVMLLKEHINENDWLWLNTGECFFVDEDVSIKDVVNLPRSELHVVGTITDVICEYYDTNGHVFDVAPEWEPEEKALVEKLNENW